MSMAVDLSKPIGPQERAYLAERGLYADLERADAMHGTDAPALPTGDGTGLQPVSLLTSEQQASEKARLVARLRELGVDVPEEDSTPATEDGDTLPPYETWDVKELDAELKRRKLATSGNKEEKANRLYDNDEQAG